MSFLAVAKSSNAPGGGIKYPKTSAVAAALAVDVFSFLERSNEFVRMKWSSRTLGHHTEIGWTEGGGARKRRTTVTNRSLTLGGRGLPRLVISQTCSEMGSHHP